MGIISLSPLLTTLPTQAETVTQQSGNITAELSYQMGESCLETPLKIKITRNQEVIVNSPVTFRNVEPCHLNPKNNQAITIRDLDQNREPEIIVDFYSGGAHCCFFSLIYRYEPTSKRYLRTDHEWFHTSYELKDINRDNIPEFHSADNRFAYAFTSFASSGLPIQIWQYRQGRFYDVTRQYPNLVYSDAYGWWQQFIQEQSSCRRDPEYQFCGEGYLAAYVATKTLLGQEQDAWNRVRQAYKGKGCTLERCLGREAFFQKVRTFLQTTGYRRN